MTEGNRIESLLVQEEGKTLEFKENCRSLSKIVQTVVAFANTAGGVLVIGIRDRTKEVIGLPDPLADEEKLANAFPFRSSQSSYQGLPNSSCSNLSTQKLFSK